LQDLCENHRALRGILGVGDWDEVTSFNWRRIRNTLCLINAATIERINQLVVAEGHQLSPGASEKVRADSFVVETNIHYPTESTLIWDGVRKIIPLCVRLIQTLGFAGWRQNEHLTKQIKKSVREIAQISGSKSPNVKATLPGAYDRLLKRVATILDRSKSLCAAAEMLALPPATRQLVDELKGWNELTSQVGDTAYRRTILGETVPNSDKLFSLFETHTQLYRRGKASTPNQFGRMVLVYEDGAGFISHYHFMDRDAQDVDVVVEQTRKVQTLHNNQIIEASFDRGFYSRENAQQLSQIVRHPCMPAKSPSAFAEQLANESARFHTSRKRHPGIESAIGALQSGNGLKRCRDRTENGMERYIGFAILGRNLHVLGKLLIARQNSTSQAATSFRQVA